MDDIKSFADYTRSVPPDPICGEITKQIEIYNDGHADGHSHNSWAASFSVNICRPHRILTHISV